MMTNVIRFIQIIYKYIKMQNNTKCELIKEL